jgi:hypothetical protein
VTQKRRPRWFALPQSGQGFDGSGMVGCSGPRGAKLTSGAAGRCSAPACIELRFPATGGEPMGGMLGG